MYGTVFTFEAKPGTADDVKQLFAEWQAENMPQVPGALHAFVYQLDANPNRFIGCAVFEDKKVYFDNADNPEQDKWFRRLRELMIADPEWNDGEISGS